MNELCCEAPDCSIPGTICPACEECLCWQHRYRSSCETCHKLLSQGSFEHRLARLLSIGFNIFLCGILFLLLPRDMGGAVIQLAVSLLVVGSLLIWLGLLGRA